MKLFNRIRFAWAYLNLFKAEKFSAWTGRTWFLPSPASASHILQTKFNQAIYFNSVKFTYDIKAKRHLNHLLSTCDESPPSHFTCSFYPEWRLKSKVHQLSRRPRKSMDFVCFRRFLFIVAAFFSFVFIHCFYAEVFSVQFKSQNELKTASMQVWNFIVWNYHGGKVD